MSSSSSDNDSFDSDLHDRDDDEDVDDDESGAYELGTVASCKSHREAHIVNVTARWSLVQEPMTPVRLDLQKMAEFGRHIGLTGPFTAGVPSLSLTCQQAPLFGPSKVFIYQGGSVTQTGYNSEYQALACAHMCANFLNKLFRTRLRVANFRVFNIVAISNTGRSIDLDRLAELLGPLCTYKNPTKARLMYGQREHSGAIVKSKIVAKQLGPDGKPRAPCVVLFSTGVMVLMGAINRDELALMMDEVDGHLARLDAQFALTVYQGPSATTAPKLNTIRSTIQAAQKTLEYYRTS